MKNYNDIAIKVQSVVKHFKTPIEQSSSLKQRVVNLARGRKGYRKFTPLNGVNFEVKEGEFFGIVGRNGSGKSTLLKSIAGIYSPDEGVIEVKGKLIPFIELGVGFSPELSGRENIYLNGSLLGFSKSEIDTMYDDIVEFAELEDFIEERLKNYSSGMQVRLAFSIAIRAKGDILLLDEVLAVGDEAFQRKCYSYFAQLKKERKTVVLVTHDMDSVQRFCDRAMLLEKGEVKLIGDTSNVAQAYRELFMDESDKTEDLSGVVANKKFGSISVDCNVTKGDVKFDIELNSKYNIEDAVVTFEIIRDTGESVYRWVTDEKLDYNLNINSDGVLNLRLKVANIFPDGTYQVQVGLKSLDRSVVYIFAPNAAEFNISTNDLGSRWRPDEYFEIV